jgi:RND family efflux transporter MFP subunit
MVMYWQSEASRVAEMVKSRVVNPQTGPETENSLRAAEASRDEATARVTVAEKAAVKAQAELAKAHEDEKGAAAKKRVAEADVARLNSLLEYRFIHAPYPGAVTRRNVDTGRFVQPAGNQKSEALFTVVRLDKVRVPIEVPEADAGLVHRGDPATIRIPALRGAEIAAKVSRTSEALDPASRTLRVEIDLKNDDGHLRPGLYVNAKITAPMPETWTLPANAVVRQAEQTVVFLHTDGKAVRVPIQSGRTDGKVTEVFKKLKPGTTSEWEEWTGTEDVLSGPANTLADGQGVVVK